MTDTQKKLLELISEINDICNKHNITYYLAGGTLIGAIRHKGFIPWDDDLDIMMTRDNWHKFIDACKTDLPPNRVLEGQELNRDYTNTFGRYTDITATSIHKAELLGGGSAGFVIDVIPLDPVPNEEAFKKYTEDMLLYSDIINPSLLYSYRYGLNKDRYFEALERIETEGKDAVLSELENSMFSYPEDECDYYVLRWGGVPFLFEKSMFGSSRRVEFEGIMCGAPDKVSDYLVQHFGDEWTTIPPHEEQEEHNAIFSTEIDYKTFQEDYLSVFDKEKAREAWIARKAYYFDEMDDRRIANKNKAILTSEINKMELEYILANSDIDFRQVIKEGRFDILGDLFKDYYSIQCSREMIGREDYPGMQRFADPIFIDVPDDVFHAAILTLINTNRVSKAHRLLEVREYAKGELSKALQADRDIITTFRQIISDYDLGDVEKSVSSAEVLYSENPYMMSIEMFLCREYIELERYEEAKILIDKCVSKYPNEGFFTKYLGDYYLKHENDKEKAIDCYNRARETTENGIALLEIDEEMERINGRQTI